VTAQAWRVLEEVVQAGLVATILGAVGWRVGKFLLTAAIDTVAPTVVLTNGAWMTGFGILDNEGMALKIPRMMLVDKYVYHRGRGRHETVVGNQADYGRGVWWWRGRLYLAINDPSSNGALRTIGPGAVARLVEAIEAKWLADLEGATKQFVDKTFGAGFRVEYLTGSGNRDRASHYSGKAGEDSGMPPAAGSVGSNEHTSFPLHSADEFGAEPNADPYATYALSEGARRVREDFLFWLDSRAWYREHGVAWRFGRGLCGPGGTGKTSLVRALAQERNIVVYSLDLASMTNEELPRILEKAVGYPHILLIEDVDCTFEGRKNVAMPEGGLTFDRLLNALDGIEPHPGRALFVTTNHPEKLDPALTRWGRVDLMEELGPLDEGGRRKVATRILDPQDVEEAVAAGVGEAGAAFKGRCVRRAEELYWARRAA
jgi:hypothetical protein